MGRPFFMLVLFSAVVSLVSVGQAQKGSADTLPTTGVPEHYAGNWVCQTAMAGYHLLQPHADLSQPQTNTMHTPSTVGVVKFALRTDGVYEASNAKGHYVFDSATQAITWLDGPHHKTMTKTQIGKRENGAPKMGFVLHQRYYGCFMAQPRPQ
jgi:hypothetical protein